MNISLVKRHIRDIFSIARQTLGLPHNKTRLQVHKIKSGFDQVAIEQDRIALIACATGLSKPRIEAFIDELNEPQWNEVYSSKLWNERGPSMMSARDRTSLYALVRGLNPEICVETGVGGGCSSSYILSALERAGSGRLFSVDVRGPHAGYYGELIPERLRTRWELLIEDDKPVLPRLLKELQVIDFFLHDSRHTFRHMTWEYEQAWRYLQPGGCLASHDVVTSTAFNDFMRLHEDEILDGGIVGNFGFIIKQSLR